MAAQFSVVGAGAAFATLSSLVLFNNIEAEHSSNLSAQLGATVILSVANCECDLNFSPLQVLMALHQDREFFPELFRWVCGHLAAWLAAVFASLHAFQQDQHWQSGTGTCLLHASAPAMHAAPASPKTSLALPLHCARAQAAARGAAGQPGVGGPGGVSAGGWARRVRPVSLSLSRSRLGWRFQHQQ